MKNKVSKAVKEGFAKCKLNITFTEAQIQGAICDSVKVWVDKGGTDKLLELYAEELTAHHACEQFDDFDNDEIAELAYKEAMLKV